MGMDDITEKASDAGLDKAGDAAEKKAGGHGDQVDKAQQAADDKIGS